MTCLAAKKQEGIYKKIGITMVIDQGFRASRMQFFFPHRPRIDVVQNVVVLKPQKRIGDTNPPDRQTPIEKVAELVVASWRLIDAGNMARCRHLNNTYDGL